MARRTATAALAGIGSRWHQRRDVHPTERVPPRPCRNPALRSGLRRGLGRTAHSAIGTRYGGSRGASAALNPGLRPFAYAGYATLPWRHPSCLRQRRVSPLVRYACTLVLPMPHYASQACRYHSIAASGRCCWHTPLRLCLRERFTLTMPCSQWCTGSPLVPYQRQRGVRHYVPHVVVCPAMLAHRRVEAASCHTDTRSLGPGIGAAVGITSQLAVPAAALRSASCQSARHATCRCEPIAHIPTPHIAAASLAIPLSAMTKARRTANTCHCAAGLRRGSGWLLESAACHGATLHFSSFRYGLRYG